MAKEEISPAEKTGTKYPKEQILRAARYAKRRDLLQVLLENNKTYTFEDVDDRIQKFLKGKVN